MRDLTELNKLEAYLKANGVDYFREDSNNTYSAEMWTQMIDVLGAHAEPMDHHQIVVLKDGRRSWDVICQRGSYGCDQGLLEGMGDIFEDVEGWLTATDVIRRIEDDN